MTKKGFAPVAVEVEVEVEVAVAVVIDERSGSARSATCYDFPGVSRNERPS